jgi:hypothetical protein
MNEEAMKPATVEVGQRWRWYCSSVAEEIRVIERGIWKCKDGVTWPTDDLIRLNSWHFAGYAPGFGPTPTLGVPTRQPGQRWRCANGMVATLLHDQPVTRTWAVSGVPGFTAISYEALDCATLVEPAALGVPVREVGQRYQSACDYSDRCFTLTAYVGDMDWGVTWDRGGKNGSRGNCSFEEYLAQQRASLDAAPATPQPEAPRSLADPALIQFVRGIATPPTIPASKPLLVNPRHAMEMQRNGVALSALDHIKARKPPEPWYPSVDEYDLLPDAGR